LVTNVNGMASIAAHAHPLKMKGMTDGCSYLNYCKIMDKWFLGGDSEMVGYRTRHTRKELEEAGFGGVFGNPLFEVEEKNNE